MTWYAFVKFLHIGCAVMWVGGAAMMQFFALRVLGARSGERLVNLARDVDWIGFRMLTPFSAGAFLTGLGLVWQSSFWTLGDDWILIGLGLFGVTFLMGVLFFGPESARVGKLIAAEGPESPAVQARTKRLIVLTRIDLVVLLPDHLRHGREAIVLGWLDDCRRADRGGGAFGPACRAGPPHRYGFSGAE